MEETVVVVVEVATVLHIVILASSRGIYSGTYVTGVDVAVTVVVLGMCR